MDDATTLRFARLIDVMNNLAQLCAGLDELDTRRGEDIDELREEVAALGAKVDALWHAANPDPIPVDPVAQSRGQVKW